MSSQSRPSDHSEEHYAGHGVPTKPIQVDGETFFVPIESVEEWFPREGHRLSWDDFKLTYHAAWRRFSKKLAVMDAIVGLAVAFLTLFFSSALPAHQAKSLALVLLAVLIILVTLSFTRAQASLVVAVRRLADHVENQRATIEHQKETLSAFEGDAKTHRQLFRANAQMYGISYDEQSIKATIDPRGGMLGVYALRIRATRASQTAIERFTFSSMDIQPSLESLGLSEAVYSIKKNLKVVVRPKIIDVTKFDVKWKLEATPEFPKDTSIDYVYKPSILPQAFTMTDTEMDSVGLEYEFLSQTITYPTKRLVITVVFPEGYMPHDPDCDVWYTHQVRVRNVVEYFRIKLDTLVWKPSLTDDQLHLELDVSYPLFGLAYAIRWSPPTTWSPP